MLTRLPRESVPGWNHYGRDGKCHAAPYGQYNHECGKPATWIGVTRHGWASGWCQRCRDRQIETQNVVSWRPAMNPSEELTQ